VRAGAIDHIIVTKREMICMLQVTVVGVGVVGMEAVVMVVEIDMQEEEEEVGE